MKTMMIHAVLLSQSLLLPKFSYKSKEYYKRRRGENYASKYFIFYYYFFLNDKK